MSRATLENLEHHAVTHAVDWDGIDLDSPIDLERPFLCETVTPLYYSDAYVELTPAQRLRYNQLTGMSYNEVIGFFEEHFAQNILGALIHGPGLAADLDGDLITALTTFAEDEIRHTRAFRALNRLSAPEWYRDDPAFIVRPSPFWLRLVRFLTRRPQHFPVVLWLALVMEERSLDASRALLRRKASIEPHYLAVYSAHLKDEVRHVHLDWHLLERFYRDRSPLLRRLNARLFTAALPHFFLAPMRTGRRVVELLIDEFPDLRPRRARLVGALRALAHNRKYHEMMYSRQSIPIAFKLFDQFEEFRPLGRYLLAYEPRAERTHETWRGEHFHRRTS